MGQEYDSNISLGQELTTIGCEEAHSRKTKYAEGVNKLFK